MARKSLRVIWRGGIVFPLFFLMNPNQEIIDILNQINTQLITDLADMKFLLHCSVVANAFLMVSVLFLVILSAIKTKG